MHPALEQKEGKARLPTCPSPLPDFILPRYQNHGNGRPGPREEDDVPLPRGGELHFHECWRGG